MILNSLIFNELNTFDIFWIPQNSQKKSIIGSDVHFCVWAQAHFTPTFDLSKALKESRSVFEMDVRI
jgi:hypothetical protein